jgi:hypothetical protein
MLQIYRFEIWLLFEVIQFVVLKNEPVDILKERERERTQDEYFCSKKRKKKSARTLIFVPSIFPILANMTLFG